MEEALSQPDVFDNPQKYKELAKEHSYLQEIKQVMESRQSVMSALDENKKLLVVEEEQEMRLLLEEEIKSLEERLISLTSKLETLLVPPDPDDDRNVIMELRAGTGGDEAALFVGDCVRMYKLYADKCGWETETLSSSPSEFGGYKEYIMAISGDKVKRFLQFEAGTHRVQRVPETEAQGRVHTSAITIAIILEPSKEEAVTIEERDLKIDTFRSSGAGGQHVNVTDSAVRITHIPTGIIVACQDERSQHKNKDKAMRLLKARIAEQRKEKQREEEASLRASQVGSGDRSERIRTYNFPQNRLTDHRISLTLYQLNQIMNGDLDCVVHPLVKHFLQKKLSS